VASNPDYPEAQYLLGLTLYDQGNYNEARGIFKTLVHEFDNQPKFRHKLAVLLSTTGEFTQAEHHFLETLRLKPDDAVSLYGLSLISSTNKRELILEHALKILESNQLSSSDQSIIHSVAGKLFDGFGQYDKAWYHFEKANQLHHNNFDPSEWEKYYKSIISSVDVDFFSKKVNFSNSKASPIFIVGMPRSGTSLIEQILSSHTKVFGAGERHDICGFTMRFEKDLGESYPGCLTTVQVKELDAAANEYLTNVQETTTDHIADKMPSNFLYLAVIACLFPNAKIIHARRNPLDNCISCYFQKFANGQEFSYNLEHLGKVYRSYEQLMSHWHRILPIPILDVSYEDLVLNGTVEIRRILKFCKLEWDEACTTFYKTKRPVKTLSKWQVRQPLYQTSMNRWKNYEPYLGTLVKALKG